MLNRLADSFARLPGLLLQAVIALAGLVFAASFVAAALLLALLSILVGLVVGRRPAFRFRARRASIFRPRPDFDTPRRRSSAAPADAPFGAWPFAPARSPRALVVIDVDAREVSPRRSERR